MGLKSGHATSYTIDKLDFNTLLSLIKQRQLRRAREDAGPVVDIDVSWVVRRCTNMSYNMRVMTLMRLSLVFIKSGCRVCLVFDGENRHHSKRATTKRKIIVMKNKMDCRLMKCELSLMTNNNPIDINSPEYNRITVLKKKIKTVQKQMSEFEIDVGDKLLNNVLNEIKKLQQNHQCSDIESCLTCVVAEFQADLVLSYRTIHQINDIVICSDSDQAVHTYRECICIKNYFLKEKNHKTTLENISIFCSTKNTLEKICDHINLPIDSNIIKIPKFPILDHKCINTRCLMAVGIGCDVYVEGVPGITPKKIHDVINKDSNIGVPTYVVLTEIYKDMYIKKKKKEQKNYDDSECMLYMKMINTFVQSYLYEPANYSIKFGVLLPEVTQQDNLYVTEYPTELHPYNKQFARNINAINIVNADHEINICCGFGQGEGHHVFIGKEGTNLCKGCQQIICNTCSIVIDNNNSETTCLMCYGELKSMPINDIEQSIINLPEMSKELADIGASVRLTDDSEEIEDLYEIMITRQQQTYDGVSLQQQIKYPTKNSTYQTEIKKISEIKIKDGGMYMANKDLTSSQKIQLTSLFAELVTLPTLTENENKTIQLIPPILKKFAIGSRVCSHGHRLMRRAVRHGIDPRSPDIRQSTGYVIEENGKIGLALKHQIKASMKAATYQVQVAFTSSDIVTCSCNCRAGSMLEEQIVCVHILPVLFQLTQILYFGMSQHILIEASNYFNGNEEVLTIEERKELLDGLKLLAKADIGYDNSYIDIPNILQQYSVGTERSKSTAFLSSKYCYKTKQFIPTAWTQGNEVNTTNTNQYCALRHLDLSSAASKVIKQRIFPNHSNNNNIINEQENNNNSEINEEMEEQTPITSDTYQNICATIQAMTMCHTNKSDNEPMQHLVGFKILQHRCINQPTDADVKLAAREWKHAIDSANVGRRKKVGGGHRNVVNVVRRRVINDITSINTTDINNSTSTRKSLPNYRRYCSVCSTSSNKNNDTTFYTVPIINTKINAQSNNKERLQQATQVFRRKIYMSRLKLHNKRGTKYVYFCDKHEVHRELFEVKYKDKSNQTFTCNKYMIVPVHPNLSKRRCTRALTTMYQPIVRMKRKNNMMGMMMMII